VFEIFLFSVITLFSYLGIEAFRRWSLRRELLDVPNKRSSHTRPTPRGGGLIIVLVCLIVYSFYTLLATGTFAWAYVVGAVLVAGISWLDDLYTVSFIWRFCIHAAAALLVIFSIGYFQEIYIPLARETRASEIVGITLTFFGIVWLTNAYNFMDGIDGVAGMQALTAGIGWLVVGKLLGVDSVGFYGGVIAFTSIGFLIHNWQPAKIFMGDVGSAFLGYTFAVLPLLASREIVGTTENRRLLPIIAVVLNWLFIFDTIYTFAKRLLNRERVWEAHRTHIYQKFNIAGFSHQMVTILYGAISSITIITTILWIKHKDYWEVILLLSIAFQSLGLLFYLRVIQNRKH